MTFLIFIPSVGIPGAFWRAIFVAALALIGFALSRYWKSLHRYSKQSRYLLVSLRGVSLVLVAFVLVGMQVGYERQMPLRILVQRAFAQSVDDSARGQAATREVQKVIEFLKDSDFEVAERDETVIATDTYPAAAIIVTDGAMRAREASAEVERGHVASGGGPVFVVSDFDSSNGPRVAIESITVMNRAVRGVPLIVRCVAHARGMHGRASLVTVSDDAQVRGSAEARWVGDDERQELTLEVVPKVAGWINYAVRAEGVGVEDPTTLSHPLTIYVAERRQRILFLESEPTWEAKFIRRALEKSELFDVDYFAQVSRAAMLGAKDEQGGNENGASVPKNRADPELTMRAALSSAARLNTYDCVIVGATLDALLSNAEATRLREWVERRGGGIIILGGNSFSGSIVGPKGKLGSLMPAEIDTSSFRSVSQTLVRNTPIEAEKSRGGIVLTPTDAGRGGAMRAFSSAHEGSARSGTLTGEGFRLGPLRPGASVLAVRGQPGEQGTNQDEEPLIVTMRYGAGRSVVFAPSDSWRMRTSESGDQTENDSPFATLWQGMALWAASPARSPVEIVMSDESPEAGSDAIAEIRVRDDDYAPLAIEKLSARVEQINESAEENVPNFLSARQISFFPDPNDASIWRARFTAPQPGRFELRVDYDAHGKTGTVEKYFATVAPSSTESGASRDTLSRVSRETGGDLISASALNSLREKLSALPQNKKSVRRILELRSWWPLALIIPLLLSCEWLVERLRRRADAIA